MIWASKGFGGGGRGGGFGSKTSSSNKKQVSQKTMLKRLEKKYGGTSAQQIGAGTQKIIEKAMSGLPPHLQMATKLYQQLRQWNARLETMSILEQANIPVPDIEGAKRAQDELERICAEHDISDNELHNVFQQITWDASADAKAARSIAGKMPADIAARIDKACSIVVDAVERAGKQGRCLDVGCGFGTLVPNLLVSNKLQPSQIYGVDLSPEMIRNANEFYPDCNFEACDFLQYKGPPGGDAAASAGFDGILFCSALHDMPDPVLALRKAASLLRPGGKLVVVHAQGALHVNKQVAANPVLVKRGLPDAEELQAIVQDIQGGLSLETRPAKAHTARDMEEGYLAVIEKRPKA